MVHNQLFIGSQFIISLCAIKSHFDSDMNPSFFSDVTIEINPSGMKHSIAVLKNPHIFNVNRAKGDFIV